MIKSDFICSVILWKLTLFISFVHSNFMHSETRFCDLVDISFFKLLYEFFDLLKKCCLHIDLVYFFLKIIILNSLWQFCHNYDKMFINWSVKWLQSKTGHSDHATVYKCSVVKIRYIVVCFNY